MIAKRTIYFFVNGIATWPGDARNWNKRAVTWTHLHTADRAQSDEYFTTALTVWIKRHERAEVFADLLRKFEGWNIVIVAHSNGARVALDALKICHWVKVAALHLVCGACDADFARSGLNWALRTERVGRVWVYIAEKDKAMRLEDTLAGRALFGIYGGDKPLGLTGPRNVAPQFRDGTAIAGLDRVIEIYWPGYGHSTCWAPKHFDKTMRHFIFEPPHGKLVGCKCN